MEIDEREQRHRQFDKALEKANLQALKLKVLDGKDEVSLVVCLWLNMYRMMTMNYTRR